MSTEQPTPETDAAAFSIAGFGADSGFDSPRKDFVKAEFARTLELQRNTERLARQSTEKERDNLNGVAGMLGIAEREMQSLRVELATLRATRDADHGAAIEAAIDKLANWYHDLPDAQSPRVTLRALVATLPGVTETAKEIDKIYRQQWSESHKPRMVESILSRRLGAREHELRELRASLIAARADRDAFDKYNIALRAECERLRKMIFHILHQRTGPMGFKVEDDLIRENEPLYLQALAAAMQPSDTKEKP